MSPFERPLFWFAVCRQCKRVHRNETRPDSPGVKDGQGPQGPMQGAHTQMLGQWSQGPMQGPIPKCWAKGPKGPCKGPIHKYHYICFIKSNPISIYSNIFQYILICFNILYYIFHIFHICYINFILILGVRRVN